jgi:hypothetical protein
MAKGTGFCFILTNESRSNGGENKKATDYQVKGY